MSENEIEAGFNWETMEPQTASPEPEQALEPPEVTGRPRDPLTGRYLPAEGQGPQEPSGEPAEASEATGFSPEVQGLLAKYGGDVNQALLGALEAQKAIGGLANEVGQLRQLQEWQIQQQQEQQQQPQQRRYDYSALIDDDPARAAQLAWQNGDEHSFRDAWTAWSEDDPAAAAIWWSEARFSQLQQQVQKQLQQTAAPLYQAQQEDQMVRGLGNLAARYPDIAEHADAMTAYLSERPVLKAMLQSPHTPIDARMQLLEDAYQVSKARSGGVVGTANAGLAQAQAAANEQALKDAFVGSSATTVRTDGKKSLEQQVTEGWDKIPSTIYWGD